MKNYIIDFESLPWIESSPGFRFKVFFQHQKKIRIVEFTENFIEPDWCVNGHIGYIIEGEMEVEFEGRVQRYKTGDGLVIPRGDENKHRHYSTRQTTTLFLLEDV